jgi:hypothetical protein
MNNVETYLEFINESKEHLPYRKKNEGMFQAAYFGKLGSAIRYRIKRYPDLNDGEPVYEIHIDIHPDEQGKGLAVEMIKSFLYKEGGVGYFAHGRIINPNVYKVLDKIKQDPKWSVEEEKYGITVREK